MARQQRPTATMTQPVPTVQACRHSSRRGLPATRKEKTHSDYTPSLSGRNAYLEVGDEAGGAFPQLAEKHGLPPLLEQQQRVEHLEQVGGRLVDRTDHRTLSGGHLADGAHHHLRPQEEKRQGKGRRGGC